jgi:alpha,alpha-trehalase
MDTNLGVATQIPDVSVFKFRKELKPCRKPDFFLLKDSVSPNVGAVRLLPLLERNAKSHAPYFNSGNILFHGIGSPDAGMAEREYATFRSCLPVTPGLHHTSLFPVTNAQCANDRLTDEAAKVVFRRNGVEIGMKWLPEGRLWSPVLLKDCFRAGTFQVSQKTAVLPLENADVLGCELEFSGIPDGCEIEIQGLFFRPCEWEEDADGVFSGVVAKESPAFRFVWGCPWSGRQPPSTAVGTRFAVFSDFTPDEKQFSGNTYRLTGVLTDNRLRIFFAAGFTRDEVTCAMAFARNHAEDFFNLAGKPFKRYFSENVPAFTCSDKALERVYAELSATGYLSTIDLGYEPYHYPFSCPAAKTVAPWRMQFYHDSTFSGRSYLWLNDEKRCIDDLLQMITVQYIHCTPRLGAPIPGQIDCMPLVFNMLPQAALEFYNRTGNRDFLRAVYLLFLHFDREKCRPNHTSAYSGKYREFPDFTWLFPFHHFDSDGDWLVESQLSGDDTCRGDEFAEGTQSKNWWDFPDPPLEPADINFYVLGNRKALRRMAELFHELEVCAELDEAIRLQTAAIESKMWNGRVGLYSDITETDHRQSNVPDAQNITVPLYGGCVSQERAEQLKKNIFNPELFGTPMCLPSCPISYTGLNGKKGFRPTGYWRGLSWGVMHYEAVFGLDRYGYQQEAAFLLHRFFDALKHADLPSPENFNPLTKDAVGAPFMGFSSQMLHPFLTFTTGLRMDFGDDLCFDPIALNPEWDEFSFGPFRYRSDIELIVSWRKKEGYTVQVNSQKFNFPKPTAFRLFRRDGRFELDRQSIRELTFSAVPPLSCVLSAEDGMLFARLENHTGTVCKGRIVPRILTLDEGLCKLPDIEFCRTRGDESKIPICRFRSDSNGKLWVLTEVKIDGFAIPFSEGFGPGNIL